LTSDPGPDSGPTEASRRRRRLAAALLALRESTGLSQTEFGAKLGMNQPKVSRLETTRQVPTEAEAAAWAAAAGASSAARDSLVEQAGIALHEPVRIAQYARAGSARRQREIGAQERAVSVVRDLQIAIVPGLLQTAEYTRRQAILSRSLFPGLLGDLSATMVAWAERKEVLYDTGRRFEFVITEAALRWRPGPDDAPGVLAGQLRHLVSLSTLPNVRIGVIPWRTPMRTCPTHGFIIYGEPGVDDGVWVHTSTKSAVTEHHDPDEVAVYQRMWKMTATDAVFDDAARAELDRIATETAYSPSAAH
jgi:transcriptional regulator with XRE-family HTH domain